MAYIGSTPTSQNFISGTDYFNGTGSQTAFTLTRSVNSVNDVEVVVNNVIQQPNSYTVSGTTLTLSAAPSSGTSNVYVRYLATNQQSFTVGNNTIDYNKLTTDMQSKFAMKNRIINGDMRIDQRNAGASVTPTTNGTFTVDRFYTVLSAASKFSVQQNAGSVTPPVGFTNYLGITSLSAYSVGSGDLFGITQKIEGFNTADLAWGTASAKTVTLSFQVYSSLTGTFGGSLQNNAANRTYPFTYSVPVANTWTTINITIAGDTTGTWATDNTTGIGVNFSIGTGSTYSGTAGSWAGSFYYSATGATSVVGTSGATWYVTGVQLEAGSQATAFEYRNFGQELAFCQRYFCSSFQLGTAPANNANYDKHTTVMTAATYAVNTSWTNSVYFPTTMRAAPSTITLYSTSLANTAGKWTYYNGTWTAASAISINSTTLTNFDTTVQGSWSGGQGVMVIGAWSASAEL